MIDITTSNFFILQKNIKNPNICRFLNSFTPKTDGHPIFSWDFCSAKELQVGRDVRDPGARNTVLGATNVAEMLGPGGDKWKTSHMMYTPG